ncbi:MAG: hypothetical protein K6E19_10160 [Lachnospiraceae bacterium]|nr:hypothetical protein [Lachnospiraceae bacterium]
MSLFGNFGELYKKKDHVKFIDNYEVELEEDEKGKYHKKVKYTGPYIPVRTELKSLRPRLIAVALMAFCVVTFLVIATFMKHASVNFVLSELFLAISLFPGLYLIMGLMHLPYSGKPMQRDGYMHGMIRVLNSSGAILVFMGLELVSELLYRLRYADWMFFSEDILFLVIVILAGGISAGIMVIIRSIEVDELELNQYNEVQKMK